MDIIMAALGLAAIWVGWNAAKKPDEPRRPGTLERQPNGSYRGVWRSGRSDFRHARRAYWFLDRASHRHHRRHRGF